MKKLSSISLSALMLLFMSWTSATHLALADPGVEIVPLEHDFGDVEPGSSSSTIITVSNTGYVAISIDEISLQEGSSPDFSITLAPVPATQLMSGDSADIEVTFTPSAPGYASAVLVIGWSDGGSGIEYVNLGGVGVEVQPPPSESIADILAFFDESIAEGSLYGNGPGRSGEARKKALRNMIEAAGDLIEDGYTETACWQLLDAYERCDGLFPPPDFVNGPAASDLANMILDLIEELGC